MLVAKETQIHFSTDAVFYVDNSQHDPHSASHHRVKTFFGSGGERTLIDLKLNHSVSNSTLNYTFPLRCFLNFLISVETFKKGIKKGISDNFQERDKGSVVRTNVSVCRKLQAMSVASPVQSISGIRTRKRSSLRPWRTAVSQII